jgi:uncharacterized protein
MERNNRSMSKTLKKLKGSTELRTYSATRPMTLRTTADGSKQIAGTAISYNSRSVSLGGFTEIVSPDALKRTLRENPDILALREHSSTMLLARTTAGTLQLTNTAKGLDFVITLPKTAIGDDTAENVRLRNLTGVSFGFVVAPGGDTWSEDTKGNVTRTLLDINLFEISVCSFPAYPATSVNTRSCPASIRSKLKRSDEEIDCDDPENEDDPACDEVDDSDDCNCDCDDCQEDDECEKCSNLECNSEQCDDCPNQERAAHFALLTRRLRT